MPSLKNTALIFLELFPIERCAALVKPPMTSSLIKQKRKYLQNEKRYAKKENSIPLYSEKPFKLAAIIFLLHRHVTKNCLSQVLEQSRTGSHYTVTNLYENIPERSIPYVIIQIRNCVALLNLAPNRSF